MKEKKIKFNKYGHRLGGIGDTIDKMLEIGATNPEIVSKVKGIHQSARDDCLIKHLTWLRGKSGVIVSRKSVSKGVWFYRIVSKDIQQDTPDTLKVVVLDTLVNKET